MVLMEFFECLYDLGFIKTIDCFNFEHLAFLLC
jgi:hypothetical protein